MRTKCIPEHFIAFNGTLKALIEFTEYETYRGVDKSLARPLRKQANISVRMARISFGTLPCKKNRNLMTDRVSMLLKSRASLTCFGACFLPGRAKDLSAARYFLYRPSILSGLVFTLKTIFTP